MASSCIACCVFHIISIPFTCSDTALSVTEAMIGLNVKILYFVMFALFLEFGARGSLAFSHLVNRAEISHMNLCKTHPGNLASPVNRAHVKRQYTFTNHLNDTASSVVVISKKHRI